MSRDKGWREFEKLVARIEAEAAPRGAVVKSPDRIRDMVTRRMREVDASIRFQAGTVPILVTIECRKRSRRADDVWIEQLATKRQRLGAAKTIAVSASGFSKTAVASALQCGIELRQLSEIRPDEIGEWFLPHGVVHLFRLVEDVRCQVYCVGIYDPREVDGMTPAFRHDLVHGLFPGAVFLSFIEMKDPMRFWALPLDGTKTRVTFHLDGATEDLIPVPLGVPRLGAKPLRIVTEGVEHEVTRLELSALVSYEAAVFDRNQGKHHVYQTPEGGSGVEHSSFEGEVFGLPVRFDHQREGGGQGQSTVEWPSGLRLSSTSIGIPAKPKKEKDGDA